MKQVSVYDVIKKQNGEHFAKAIRSYNNGIFDIPDIVNIVKYAGSEAEPIMNYLISLMDIQIKETEYEDPFVLLKKAGYNAYYADTLEKQNDIQKYFKYNESLCTFRDNSRFENYYIINAVKENVDDIKRENFTKPEREDEYGTSVISIQILKNGGFISIKNRYNHTVANPDNTFFSNPDNIIYGLSYSLKKYFDVDFSATEIPLPNKYTLIGNKIIKYNYEIYNHYFGDDFYLKNGKIIEINKNTEVMIEQHILNVKDKTITSILQDEKYFQNEAKIFQKELENKTIQIVKKDDKTKSILLDGKEFVNLNNSRIIKLTLERALELPCRFLYYNEDLKYLNCPITKIINNDVLYNNIHLKDYNLPKVEYIYCGVLRHNKDLEYLDLPNVRVIDDDTLATNQRIKSVNLPKVEKIGRAFLFNNLELEELNMPKVNFISHNVLRNNNKLKHLDLPNVQNIDMDFLSVNNSLETINLPLVKEIDDFCFLRNTTLKKIYMPNIENIGYNSFSSLIVSKHNGSISFSDEAYSKKAIDIVKFYSKER